LQSKTEGYPKENVGTSIGSVIPDFSFPGFVDPIAAKTQTEIRLGHFYNKSGAGKFGPNDPFADGTPQPTILVIDVSGKWCAPCKEEAAKVLPKKWDALHGKGLMILTVLADSDKVGQPASIKDLESWSTSYPGHYPMVIDPTYQMGGLFDQNQFPANFIIDTRTMKIVDFYGGKPPETFWEKAASLL
jgi:thiol-disulfide isomerase/thioredoxin